jgi:hypothetical protein
MISHYRLGLLYQHINYKYVENDKMMMYEKEGRAMGEVVVAM